MAKREEDESFELQQNRWTELINLRQAMIDHKMDTAGVELAISNVFDPKKGRIIESMILDGQKLMATILRLEELRIDPSNVKMTLEKAFLPGMNGAYDSDLLRLKGMIEMREQMAAMGLPTGCVEVSISEVFKVSQVRRRVEGITDRLSHCRPPQRLSGLKKCPRLLPPSHFHQRRESCSP